MKTSGLCPSVVLGVVLLAVLSVGGYFGVRLGVDLFRVLDPQTAVITAIASAIAFLCTAVIYRGFVQIGQREAKAQMRLEKVNLYERVLLIWGAKLKSRATSIDPSVEGELQQLAQLLILCGNPKVIKAYLELHALERMDGLHSPDIPSRVAAVLMEMRQDLGAETTGLTAEKLLHLLFADAAQASTPAPAPAYQDLQPRVSLAASS